MNRFVQVFESLFLIVAPMTVWHILPANAQSADDNKEIAFRPFYMGFTPWPADISVEGIRTAEEFMNKHGDIVSIMFNGGIPWQESLDGKPFSADVEKSLHFRPSAGKKVFLSISILNMDRKGLAPYWGVKENMPLPSEWANRAFNSPEVKKAYLAFTLRAVEAMHPDYLAIGVELNALLSHDPVRWKQLKELIRETYAAVKSKHPNLPVFFTTEVVHYKRLNTEAKGSDQEHEVADLMKSSDVFAMSFYPFMSYEIPEPVPADIFDFAKSFHKPIAVSETGMTSRDVELKSYKLTLHGSETAQTQFIQLLLKTATRDRYLFVVNFATTDFEKLCSKLPPPSDDLARIWSYTGLQDEDGKPKPALKVWDTYLRAKVDR